MSVINKTDPARLGVAAHCTESLTWHRDSAGDVHTSTATARVRALAVLIIKCLFAVMPQTRSKSKKENLEVQTRASARPLSHSPAMRAPGDLFLFFPASVRAALPSSCPCSDNPAAPTMFCH